MKKIKDHINSNHPEDSSELNSEEVLKNDIGADISDEEKPVLEHLRELRKVILKVLNQ